MRRPDVTFNIKHTASYRQPTNQVIGNYRLHSLLLLGFAGTFCYLAAKGGSLPKVMIASALTVFFLVLCVRMLNDARILSARHDHYQPYLRTRRQLEELLFYLCPQDEHYVVFAPPDYLLVRPNPQPQVSLAILRMPARDYENAQKLRGAAVSPMQAYIFCSQINDVIKATPVVTYTRKAGEFPDMQMSRIDLSHLTPQDREDGEDLLFASQAELDSLIAAFTDGSNATQAFEIG